MARNACIALVAAALLGCGTNIDLGGVVADAAPPHDGSTSTCPGSAPPDAAAKCVACEAGAAGCQANGCYGGYYCKLSRLDCQPMNEACDDKVDGETRD